MYRLLPMCMKTPPWMRWPVWLTFCKPRHFLCRQTNFIQNVCAQQKPVNIKKGQFLSPWDMQQVVDKAAETGNRQIMVCERGASFGYNNLVSDMRSLAVMRQSWMPGRFRCHAFGTVTRWSGQFVGWATRIRASTCASCCGSGRFRSVYGNSSGSGKGTQRWPQCVAAGANAIVAGSAD